MGCQCLKTVKPTRQSVRNQPSARQVDGFTLSALLSTSKAVSATWQKRSCGAQITSSAGGYFRRANGDIRQMKEAATEPASMVEPTQRFKGFSLIFDALPA